jgi:membrane protein DedA with SNARE-associated domain
LLVRFKVREERLARLEGYFTHYGRALILIARFLDGLRQLNGIVAGMLKMPWRVFMTYNILGAIFWSGVWGAGAYWLDKEINAAHLSIHRLEPWVVVLTLGACLALFIYLFHHHKSKNCH